MVGAAPLHCGREGGRHSRRRHTTLRPRGGAASPKAWLPSQGESLGFLQGRDKTGLKEWRRRGRRYRRQEEKVIRKKNRRKEAEGGSWVMRLDQEKGRKKAEEEMNKGRARVRPKAREGEKEAPVLC